MNHIGGAILCGVDGSPESEAAVATAQALATRLGTRLVLAYVAEPARVPLAHAAPLGIGMAGPGIAVEEREQLREQGIRLLDRVSDAAGLSEVDYRVEIGPPAERLADIADEEDAELIVVGSRGRGALTAAFLGSVSNSLAGIARRPVLIVPREQLTRERDGRGVRAAPA
jgi:nucleotide-binding universal stress UspA family protein